MRDKVTLYHDAANGGQKQWSIWFENPTTITVEWGLVGGALQRSTDTAKAKGRVGTKAFKPAEQVARETYDRQIKKKREQGYLGAMETRTEIDLFTRLTKNFVPAKPRTNLTEQELRALDNQHKVWWQRKRDGQRHLVLYTNTGDVRIYSRRLEDLTDNFPLLRQSLRGKFPNRTILDGEVLIIREGDRDDFRAVNSITKAKPGRAAAYEKEHFNDLRYMVFDVLYYDGQPVWEKPYENRYNLLNGRLFQSPQSNHVYLAPLLSGAFSYLAQKARDQKWEGLIAWFPHEKTTIRLTGGSPKRVNCAKWKPIQERDFIATGYELGSGNFSKVVGALKLAEYGPDGILRDCGNCGTGFNDQIRKEALSWTYPCVVSVQFDRQEPTGKLRFPVFLKLHEDKTPDEVVGPELGDE